MSKSNYLEDAILNHVLRNTALTSPTTVYCALSTTDPTEDGSGITELAGAAYARKAITFGAPSGGIVTNSAELDFGTTEAADNGKTITHFAIFDALTVGNMLYHAALTTPQPIVTGNLMKFPIGTLTVQEQ